MNYDKFWRRGSVDLDGFDGSALKRIAGKSGDSDKRAIGKQKDHSKKEQSEAAEISGVKFSHARVCRNLNEKRNMTSVITSRPMKQKESQ
jgi:hypothetical protein